MGYMTSLVTLFSVKQPQIKWQNFDKVFLYNFIEFAKADTESDLALVQFFSFSLEAMFRLSSFLIRLY